MSRHGKNCTAGAVYTYHEKMKDSKSGGYGLQRVRLTKDSIKEFNACCLTLQPCRDPVVTPEGYLYEREAILECLLKQKKDYSRKLKAWERQNKREEEDNAKIENGEALSKLIKFKQTEGRILPSSSEQSQTRTKNDELVNSFWIPSLTPQAFKEKVPKPDKSTYCLMSGNPLSIRDLISVRFKPLKGEVNRFECAVTGDILGNSVPCSVLKPTGDVVTTECVNKLIRPDLKEIGEMIHPISGETLEECDIIKLQRGGTGFAGCGVQLNASKKAPSLMF